MDVVQYYTRTAPLAIDDREPGEALGPPQAAAPPEALDACKPAARTKSASDGRRTVVRGRHTLWFIAFGTIAAEIAHKARKGDQLILEANIIAHNWTENGHKQTGRTFIVTDYRSGAKGRYNGPAASSRCAVPPDKSQPDAGQAELPSVSQEAAEAAAAR